MYEYVIFLAITEETKWGRVQIWICYCIACYEKKQKTVCMCGKKMRELLNHAKILLFISCKQLSIHPVFEVSAPW